jgi:KilA-N domain
MATFKVLDHEITVQSREDADYICLTDIACYTDAKRTNDPIRNWLRNRNTVEFLGLWEQWNNPRFNPVEFDGFRIQAGLNSFTLTPKAVDRKDRAGLYGP